jgi:hypothetical protein
MSWSTAKHRSPRRATQKIYIPLDDVELRQIDKFSYDNGLRFRSKAIRRLIKIGVRASKQGRLESRPS